MAGLAAAHLRDRRVGALRVLNRSVPHGRALADRTGAGFGGLDELGEALAEADLVVSATGAAGTVIDGTMVRAAVGRRDLPLVLVDIAVPRDVAPSVADIDNVRLIDIGAIRERLATHHDETAADIAKAKEIVAEEVRRWVVRRRSDALAPVIREIRRRGDDVVAAELARFARRLDDLTPDERDAVEALARSIAAKLLHDPIVQLKERSEPASSGAHAKLLAELFGFDPHAE
jgi:glutamyl-tRNA reductase